MPVLFHWHCRLRAAGFDKVLRRFTAQYRHYAPDAQSLAGNTIYRCLLDTAGNLFLAVADHGIDYTNIRQALFTPLLGTAATGAAGISNNISALLPVSTDRLLLGLSDGGLALFDVPTSGCCSTTACQATGG